MASQRTLSLIAIAFLAAVTCAVYSRALNSPFIFDDSGSVTDNPSIVRLWPLVGDAEHPGPLNPPVDLPTSGRPLVNLSLAVNYYFGELNPRGYHLFNLIVHVLSAVLLMAIVRRTLCLDYFEGRFQKASGPLALIAALVWAVHPLQTETVVYITQRTELLVGFFYLATLYASLRYWDAASPAGRNTWLALATLACLAGMACKEVMVTAPVVVLLFERTFLAGTFRRALQKSWPLYVGLFASWGLLYWLNHAWPRSGSAGFRLWLPTHAWWFTQTKVLLMYLKLAVWPWPLAIHYEMEYLPLFSVAWPWVVAVALLGSGTLLLFWRRKALGFVGAWVLLILSPTLVVPIVTEVAAERRMYLPLAAIVTLFVAGGYWLTAPAAWARVSSAAKRQPTRQWSQALAPAAAIIVVIILSAISVRRLAAYHDALTLWQDNVNYQPDNPLAQNNLGNELFKGGKTGDAIEHYRRALELKPNYTDAQINLATALSNDGQYQEAIENFQHVLQTTTGHPEAHCNLGVALAKSGRFEEAIAEYQETLRLKPDYFNAWYNVGNLLWFSGRKPQAIAAYQRAVQLDPRDAAAHYNLANALQDTKRLGEAIQQYQLALQMRPVFPEAHNSLGSALLQAGRTDEAIEHYKLAVQQNPNHANAYANMAIAYAHMERSSEAIAAAEKALELARASGSNVLDPQLETWLKNYRESVSKPLNPTAEPERAR